ncbi:hypothetical protein [Streptomyces sp. NPDC046870]|uniref:hypothetical protein n=1 Tax=Streptomyces sp. NPDC046870 TaxID=3155135 RepID=UPI00345283FE
MPSPSRSAPGTSSGDQPEADFPQHRAAELAARITGIIRTLDALDLTGTAPAPVFTVTGRGATGGLR